MKQGTITEYNLTENHIWSLFNFVLSCPACNREKSNKVPARNFLVQIEDRNRKIQLLENTVIQTEFTGYTEEMMDRMWNSAKLSGFKEYK